MVIAMRSFRAGIACAALLCLIAGTPPTSQAAACYQFIASEGYYASRSLYYLMTDVSDGGYAVLFNANNSPLLANALNNPYLPSVYWVSNYSQPLIFSADWPASYAPGGYVPIWVLNTVTWLPGRAKFALRSAADVQSARNNNKVSVRTLRVVVGASIIVNSSGAAMPQARVTRTGGVVRVMLPVAGVFVSGTAYKMARLDFSNYGEARAYGGTYAPLLSQFNTMRAKFLPSCWQNVYSIWGRAVSGQLAVAMQTPSPFGPHSTNASYSPLMMEWEVHNDAGPAEIYTSYAAIVTGGFPLTATNNVIFQPVLGQ
jgi:hypothetical protein